MSPQRSPKWSPKLIKVEDKISITYEGFQVPLGSVLGPAWAVVGSIFGSKIIKCQLFYKGSVNIVFLKKIRLGSASWTDLGSILMPKGAPKDSQIGPKMEPKWDRKTIKK